MRYFAGLCTVTTKLATPEYSIVYAATGLPVLHLLAAGKTKMPTSSTIQIDHVPPPQYEVLISCKLFYFFSFF